MNEHILLKVGVCGKRERLSRVIQVKQMQQLQNDKFFVFNEKLFTFFRPTQTRLAETKYVVEIEAINVYKSTGKSY